MNNKIAHFLYVPLLGLGLYGGHRGNRWLKNRIKIFKQFVVPSMQAQSDKDFIVWVSARFEDRNDRLLFELRKYLEARFEKVVFTFSGVCFWDDKYEDKIAHERLVSAVHGAMGELLNAMGDADTVLMTIQPSDDCYYNGMVYETKREFEQDSKLQCFGYKKGFVMDYNTLRMAEWNPKTTPPFYTIKFSRDDFTDPYKHLKYTGAYKSHEYVKDFLKAKYIDYRAFIVGTHGENISTIFNHPFKGAEITNNILNFFGLYGVEPLHIHLSLRKWIMRKLPYGWQRKLRYIFGQRFYARFYNWIRS